MLQIGYHLVEDLVEYVHRMVDLPQGRVPFEKDGPSKRWLDSRSKASRLLCEIKRCYLCRDGCRRLYVGALEHSGCGNEWQAQAPRASRRLISASTSAEDEDGDAAAAATSAFEASVHTILGQTLRTQSCPVYSYPHISIGPLARNVPQREQNAGSGRAGAFAGVASASRSARRRGAGFDAGRFGAGLATTTRRARPRASSGLAVSPWRLTARFL